MRILIQTRAFLPLVGGLELAVALLAEEFARLGHEVVVVTSTPATGDDHFPYRVVRNPGGLALLRWMRWCEVFHQPNVGLRGLWPLALVPRPWVVAHHSWYRRPGGRIAWQDRLKRALLSRASGSISVSRAIAEDLGTPSVVIGNAYRDEMFRILPGVERKGDLLCVGRLVSDKGIDLLIDALGSLAEVGIAPSLTVVGEGPERAALGARARGLGLAGDRVKFRGLLTGEALVREFNAHRILVVPSRYNEPFGTVALEGIACGCVVVGSLGGGLVDAIGECGLTFPNGDRNALAQTLAVLLESPDRLEHYRSAAAAHLEAHTANGIACRYLEVFRAAAGAAP